MPLKQKTTKWRDFPSLGFIFKAVSFRIPMPVTEIVQYASGDCYSICPRCNTLLEREYIGFCDCCGQKLSWSALDLARIRIWGR